MSARKVTVIVLCWNRWALTRRCLETLREHTDLTNVEVLAVDNGSTDGTPDQLARLDWVRTVRLPSNLGYVRGNNAGIAASNPASDVLLLNNDTEILHPGWIEGLQKAALANPGAGIVGGRLVLPDGRLLHAGTYVLPDTYWGQQIGALEADVNQYARDREVQGIVFACAYIRREVLDAIGPLSLDYTSYFEDTDFCLRAKAAGFSTIVAGGVNVLHHEHGSTSDTPEVFDRLFQASRRHFRQTWAATLEGRYTLSLDWQSIMNFPSGYAMSCREILRALEEAGVRTRYSYAYGKGTPFPVLEPPDAGDYVLNVIAGRSGPRRPPLSVVYGQGDVFFRNRGRYKVGYTMLEVDGFPREWVRQANEMDEVWVPSAFNREGLLSSGVKKPVHVMPLGVDIDHFHPGIKGFRNPHGDFVFLSNFEWSERKDPARLLTVFNQTFRYGEKAVLVCKIINTSPAVDVKRQIRALRLKPSGGRVLFLYNTEFPPHQLGALYRSADCYVAASRGEGWDLPLMEAMACGLPSIATDWGAHTEFVSDGISYPLRIHGTVPAVSSNPYYGGFSWAEVDPAHLSQLLRHVFENQAEARERGARAAAEMAASWTWAHAARRIRARVEEVLR